MTSRTRFQRTSLSPLVRIAVLVDVVVQERSDHIVRRGDGVEVTGEVQVNLLHGKHLSVATTSSTALHTEARAERGLTQCDDRLITESVHTESEADRDRRLADTCFRGSDGGDEDELARLMTSLGARRGLPWRGTCRSVQVVGGIATLAATFRSARGLSSGRFRYRSSLPERELVGQ